MNIHNSKKSKFTLTLAIVVLYSIIFFCHNVAAMEVETNIEAGSDLTEQAVLDLIRVLAEEFVYRC